MMIEFFCSLIGQLSSLTLFSYFVGLLFVGSLFRLFWRLVKPSGD